MYSLIQLIISCALGAALGIWITQIYSRQIIRFLRKAEASVSRYTCG